MLISKFNIFIKNIEKKSSNKSIIIKTVYLK